MSSDNNEEEECSVRVAIRIRPQNSREIIDMCRICTSVTPSEPQINLGVDKAFTFDYVFDTDTAQPDIYQNCVEQLVEGALRGYNATVLAYGQTGSGKTYTMGTGFDYHLTEEEQGIIPRALFHIFSRIEEVQLQAIDDVSDTETVQFNIAVQFIELYNENIVDLLEPYSKGRIHKIQENELGLITVSGASIKPIQSPQEALRYLQQGALARTTASTQMNIQSSRSHAVFTLLIRRLSQNEYDVDEYVTLTSKFHFVDLAGSERLKRTGATGDRAKEGISINSGLLALGNCISALGDKSRRATHVPYRDSKLTRLLQDSLGGNSQTLMIACISPSDRDFMETLNTLKYANRAKNIKNKVQLNQDQSSRTIAQLRKEIARLQLELMELKQGKREVNMEGKSFMTDTFHENEMLLLDNKRLQQRLKSMNEAINALTERNTQLRLEKEMNNWPSLVDTDQSVKNLIQGYISEIEKLQAKLIESEEMYQQLRKNDKGLEAMRNAKFHCTYQDPEDLIKEAKRELEKEKNIESTRSSNKESIDSDESEQESQQKSNDVEEDLEDVNNDIEIKTKLIQQLELSQQRMQLMRQQYEDKLMLLSSQVINTQKERDEVLSFIGSNGDNQNSDKMKKVKAEYEQKINNMQREIKKLHQAQREHNRQRQEIISQETKLKNLRSQLEELKCNKARLIRKLGEQASKFRMEETQKIREIAQLRKEQRKQENTVRSLQARMQAKEQVLKRKTEEVTSLRRSQRSIRRNFRSRIDNSQNFDTRLARKQWYNMSHVLDRHARNKQMMMQFENELERLMNERDRLSSDLLDVQKRTSTSSNDLDNEEDLIKSNLTYVQESINNTQQALLQFDDSKDFNVGESHNVQNFINEIDNIDEAKYLLERLSTNSVDLLCKVANLENHLQERIALLKEAQQECLVQQQLLQHFIAQNNLEKITDLFESLSLSVSKSNCIRTSGSQKSLKSNETYDVGIDEAFPLSERNRSSSPELVQDMINKKIRSRTAQPYNMLFGEKDEGRV
ncbi:kinesin-like protein KIF21A isoform 2-T2 [Glossina fuscipes fuscipes]